MQRKGLWAAALAVVAMFSLFMFPAARATASELLGLFRVNKFAPISISPQQLDVLAELADSGLYPGEVEMLSEPSEPIRFDSFAELDRFFRKTSGQYYGLTSYENTLGTPNLIEMHSGARAQLTVDLDSSRKILSAVDIDPALLPDSLDGADITVNMEQSVMQSWGDVEFVQMPSPEIRYPEDVDPAVIGEAALRFLGMSDVEAKRLANNIDWTNTVLLPIPTDIASFSEVKMANTTALGIESLDGEGAALLWEEYGYVYMLNGSGDYSSIESLVKLADN